MRYSENATIIHALMNGYVKYVNRTRKAWYKSMLVDAIRAVGASPFQRQACQLEAKAVPEVRATLLVLAACHARLDLVRLFTTLGFTTDAEVRQVSLSQRSNPEDCDPAAVQEVVEFLSRPRSLGTQCLLRISDSVAPCPD